MRRIPFPGENVALERRQVTLTVAQLSEVLTALAHHRDELWKASRRKPHQDFKERITRVENAQAELDRAFRRK